jgi:hypothetical protein
MMRGPFDYTSGSRSCILGGCLKTGIARTDNASPAGEEEQDRHEDDERYQPGEDSTCEKPSHMCGRPIDENQYRRRAR